MKKVGLGVVAISLLALTPTWAGKFWEEGDFLEWTEKDVIKMLNKSPWARHRSRSVSRRAVAARQGPRLEPDVEAAVFAAAVSAAAAVAVAVAVAVSLPP